MLSALAEASIEYSEQPPMTEGPSDHNQPYDHQPVEGSGPIVDGPTDEKPAEVGETPELYPEVELTDQEFAEQVQELGNAKGYHQLYRLLRQHGAQRFPGHEVEDIIALIEDMRNSVRHHKKWPTTKAFSIPSSHGLAHTVRELLLNEAGHSNFAYVETFAELFAVLESLPDGIVQYGEEEHTVEGVKQIIGAIRRNSHAAKKVDEQMLAHLPENLRNPVRKLVEQELTPKPV